MPVAGRFPGRRLISCLNVYVVGLVQQFRAQVAVVGDLSKEIADRRANLGDVRALDRMIGAQIGDTALDLVSNGLVISAESVNSVDQARVFGRNELEDPLGGLAYFDVQRKRAGKGGKTVPKVIAPLVLTAG